MRLARLALVAVVSTGCAHPLVSGDGTPDQIDRCKLYDTCWGGPGTYDGYVALAVVGTVIATVGVVAIRYLVDH